MSKFIKKGITIPMIFVLFFGGYLFAQNPEEKPPEMAIYCAELDLVVKDFETTSPSIVRICCGGPFRNGSIPCAVISKASYESFTGQSEADFMGINQGISVDQLLEPKRQKRSKIQSIDVINSSIPILPNGLKMRIKKGLYAIDNNREVWLEVEYLK